MVHNNVREKRGSEVGIIGLCRPTICAIKVTLYEGK